MVKLRSTEKTTRRKCYAPHSHFQCCLEKQSLHDMHIHYSEEGPDIVVGGARLPSILRLASCLSS